MNGTKSMRLLAMVAVHGCDGGAVGRGTGHDGLGCRDGDRRLWRIPGATVI
jgi:hypothetical protein